MANPLASLAKSEIFNRTSSFDTFSSYGVSVNSPLSSNIIGIGKQVLAYLDSGKYQGKLTEDPAHPGYDTVGNKAGDGYNLDMNYRVSIFSRKPTLRRVVAFLQERTELSVSSVWEQLISVGSSKWLVLGEAGMQAFGKTLINKAFSRRMWTGTSPIKMKLALRFEAISDPILEVVQPCVALLQIASPGGSEDSAFLADVQEKSKSSFTKEVISNILVPPGPSPFWKSGEIPGGPLVGDRIDVYVGNFMKFDNVIVSSVSVILDNRIHKTGMPVGANVTVNFETYEIQTKPDIQKIFEGNLITSTPIVVPGISPAGGNNFIKTAANQAVSAITRLVG